MNERPPMSSEPTLKADVERTLEWLRMPQTERNRLNRGAFRLLTPADKVRLEQIPEGAERENAVARMLTPVHGGDTEEILGKLSDVGLREAARRNLTGVLRAHLVRQQEKRRPVDAFEAEGFIRTMREAAREGDINKRWRAVMFDYFNIRKRLK
jgi:hypothetical protein